MFIELLMVGIFGVLWKLMERNMPPTRLGGKPQAWQVLHGILFGNKVVELEMEVLHRILVNAEAVLNVLDSRVIPNDRNNQL